MNATLILYMQSRSGNDISFDGSLTHGSLTLISFDGSLNLRIIKECLSLNSAENENIQPRPEKQQYKIISYRKSPPLVYSYNIFKILQISASLFL